MERYEVVKEGEGRRGEGYMEREMWRDMRL